MFTLYSLGIFVRSPYTESVSHRITPCTRVVYESCARSLYISVFLRKRSFTIVHVRPGKIERNEIEIVLSYFNFDQDKTINSFKNDEAKNILGEWTITKNKEKCTASF